MNRVNGVKTVIFFGARLGGFRVSQGEVRNPSLGMKKRTGQWSLHWGRLLSWSDFCWLLSAPSSPSHSLSPLSVSLFSAV